MRRSVRISELLPDRGIGNVSPERGLGASVKGYEVHEDKACITHGKQSPNLYPLNSHLITLTLDATFDRSVSFIRNVSSTSDPNKQISW
jgi:hypothetical protein